MQAQETCPFCEEQEIIKHKELMKSEYKGYTADLPLYFNECKFCGSKFAGEPEMRKNKQTLLDWRHIIDFT